MTWAKTGILARLRNLWTREQEQMWRAEQVAHLQSARNALVLGDAFEDERNARRAEELRWHRRGAL